jgi:hypothetical protein
MVSADGGAFALDSLAGDDHSEVTRRLSDKILAAFNHAYAVGEATTAKKLRQVLIDHQAEKSVPGDRRGNYNPLSHADLWVAFVEARNLYNSISEDKGANKARLDKALTEMKDAYHLWSQV